MEATGKIGSLKHTHSQTKTTNAGIEHDFKCHSCLRTGHLVDYKGAIEQCLKHMWTKVTPLYVLQCPPHTHVYPAPTFGQEIPGSCSNSVQTESLDSKSGFVMENTVSSKSQARRVSAGVHGWKPPTQSDKLQLGIWCGLPCRKGPLLSEEP